MLGDIMVDFPMDIAVVVVVVGDFVEGFVADADVLAPRSTALVRVRSPRRCTSFMRTVRPARVMFWVPAMAARREILLPESFPFC